MIAQLQNQMGGRRELGEVARLIKTQVTFVLCSARCDDVLFLPGIYV